MSSSRCVLGEIVNVSRRFHCRIGQAAIVACRARSLSVAQSIGPNQALAVTDRGCGGACLFGLAGNADTCRASANFAWAARDGTCDLEQRVCGLSPGFSAATLRCVELGGSIS